MIQIHQDNSTNLAKLEAMLQDDPAKHLYRLDRAAFTDEQLFELEMKYIFEGNWVYLAHESQIPNVNDFLTVYIGRQPVVITRSKDGKLNALANTCTHRGAVLCRLKKGNKSSFTCPFHGWTFNNKGKLLKVKDQSPDAGYPPSFNCEGSHDLVKLGAFESYRGFLFGSVNPDVAPLSGVPGRDHQDHRHDRRSGARRHRSAARRLDLHLRWQLEAAGRERRRRLPRLGRALELRRHHRAPRCRRQGRQRQGDERRRLGQARRRLVLVQERPHAAVDQLVEPGGPAAVRQAPRVDREVRRGQGRLDAAQVAQPVPVPERLPDGPVQLADPRRAADLGEQERGDDLLHRAQRRAAQKRANDACASTRTSSTPPAWPRPTTSRSSVPASTVSRPAP